MALVKNLATAIKSDLHLLEKVVSRYRHCAFLDEVSLLFAFLHSNQRKRLRRCVDFRQVVYCVRLLFVFVILTQNIAEFFQGYLSVATLIVSGINSSSHILGITRHYLDPISRTSFQALHGRILDLGP